ncbi:hypothetical protein U879_00315 [Defluviimonas sp. 20V17]|nr:hypothetical protein U879_00315 [Defluviimonas sp. 20V17]
MRILGNKAEAELTVQDLFTRIWLHAGRFNPDRERGLDFLICMARDSAIDRRRARGPVPADGSGHETAFMAHEADLRHPEGLSRVEPRCAQAITAAYLGGLTHAEIAAACGKQEAEVRPLLHDAFRQIAAVGEPKALPGLVVPDDDCSEDGMLAAEFVLGSLSLEERRMVQRRLANLHDTAFAAHVALWRARLAPLNAAYAAVSAPDLLTMIEARIFGTPVAVQQSNLKRMAVAMFGGVAAIAVVAALTAIAVRDTTPPPELYAATLEAGGNQLIFAAAWDPGSRKFEVLRTGGPAPAPGKDYQIWLLRADGAVQPLMMLRGEENVTLISHIPRDAKLGVTLEPTSDGLAAKPSGPMLLTGKVQRL